MQVYAQPRRATGRTYLKDSSTPHTSAYRGTLDKYRLIPEKHELGAANDGCGTCCHSRYPQRATGAVIVETRRVLRLAQRAALVSLFIRVHVVPVSGRLLVDALPAKDDGIQRIANRTPKPTWRGRMLVLLPCRRSVAFAVGAITSLPRWPRC